MKSLFLTLVLVVGFSSQAFAAENKAIKIDLFGGIAGFDKAGYNAVRSTLGVLLAKGVVTQFMTKATGSEGGGSFCVEVGGKLNASALTDALKPIQLDSKTVYEVTEIENCSI